MPLLIRLHLLSQSNYEQVSLSRVDGKVFINWLTKEIKPHKAQSNSSNMHNKCHSFILKLILGFCILLYSTFIFFLIKLFLYPPLKALSKNELPERYFFPGDFSHPRTTQNFPGNHLRKNDIRKNHSCWIHLEVGLRPSSAP